MKSFIDIKEPLLKQYTLSEYRDTDSYNDITTNINTGNEPSAYKEAYNLLKNSCNNEIDIWYLSQEFIMSASMEEKQKTGYDTYFPNSKALENIMCRYVDLYKTEGGKYMDIYERFLNEIKDSCVNLKKYDEIIDKSKLDMIVAIEQEQNLNDHVYGIQLFENLDTHNDEQMQERYNDVKEAYVESIIMLNKDTGKAQENNEQSIKNLNLLQNVLNVEDIERIARQQSEVGNKANKLLDDVKQYFGYDDKLISYNYIFTGEKDGEQFTKTVYTDEDAHNVEKEFKNEENNLTFLEARQVSAFNVAGTIQLKESNVIYKVEDIKDIILVPVGDITKQRENICHQLRYDSNVNKAHAKELASKMRNEAYHEDYCEQEENRSYRRGE